MPLFDFLHRAAASPAAWAELDLARRAQLATAARERWYG
jgi:hypothetical protein